MQRRLFVVLILLVGLMGLGIGKVSAQSYPDKPIHFLTAAPGGATDFQARIIAQALTANMGQQVIVENRPSGPILGGIAAKARPDGYTLLFAAPTLWVAPFLFNLTWDPVRDFSPVSLISTTPNILFVHPALPAKSVKELIALAKRRPGELNYSSTPLGSSPHIASELFKTMSGVNIVGVFYKGKGLAVSDLMSGQVQVMLSSPSGTMEHAKSGRLRALAVATLQPTALAPGLPTLTASGLPGYESVQTYGLMVPAKTPAPLINRLNKEMTRILNRADVKEKFFNSGAEAVSSSPEQFAAVVKSEMTIVGKIIKKVGVRAE